MHGISSLPYPITLRPCSIPLSDSATYRAGMMGVMPKSDVFALLDFFHSQGGNFIDTANNYQSEQSESWIGEWLASKPEGFRDQMVIATKFTTGYQTHKGFDNIIHSNFVGNNKKSLKHSLDASLKKLQTDYIDLLYVHWWDFTTSIPELMHSLNDLVSAGKVLYLGISDTPAWLVSKANEYARQKGLRQFVVYQGKWSAADRDFERDILGMCAHEGMGLAPWGALGGGNFKTKEQLEQQSKGEGRQMGGPSPRQQQVAGVLQKVADRHKTVLTSVALAYVMHKAPYVFPIVGGRKIEHLKGNIEALGLELSPEDIDEIEGAAEFDIGFPLSFLGNFEQNRAKGARGPGEVFLETMATQADYVKGAVPIRPKKLEGK